MLTTKPYTTSSVHHNGQTQDLGHNKADMAQAEALPVCFLLQSEKDALINFMLNAPIKELLHKEEQKPALSLINKLLTSSPATGNNGLNLPERFEPRNLNHWVVISLLGIAFILSAAFILSFGIFFLRSLASIYPSLSLTTDTHLMAALIGVPFSAMLGFIIVGLFGWMTKSADGFTLELGMLHFGVQGATGPLILWLACFFVLSYAFHTAFYPGQGVQERTAATQSAAITSVNSPGSEMPATNELIEQPEEAPASGSITPAADSPSEAAATRSSGL